MRLIKRNPNSFPRASSMTLFTHRRVQAISCHGHRIPAYLPEFMGKAHLPSEISQIGQHPRPAAEQVADHRPDGGADRRQRGGGRVEPSPGAPRGRQ